MKLSEIANMIKGIGVPYAYHHFPENTGQAPPFICFYYPESRDFVADDSNYRKINALTIELYTDNKDFALEEKVEEMLISNDLVYQRTEYYIDSERMYQITYTTEVLIDAE